MFLIAQRHQWALWWIYDVISASHSVTTNFPISVSPSQQLWTSGRGEKIGVPERRAFQYFEKPRPPQPSVGRRAIGYGQQSNRWKSHLSLRCDLPVFSSKLKSKTCKKKKKKRGKYSVEFVEQVESGTGSSPPIGLHFDFVSCENGAKKATHSNTFSPSFHYSKWEEPKWLNKFLEHFGNFF